MVILAQSSPGCRSTRSLQVKEATVMLARKLFIVELLREALSPARESEWHKARSASADALVLEGFYSHRNRVSHPSPALSRRSSAHGCKCLTHSSTALRSHAMHPPPPSRGASVRRPRLARSSDGGNQVTLDDCRTDAPDTGRTLRSCRPDCAQAAGARRPHRCEVQRPWEPRPRMQSTEAG